MEIRYLLDARLGSCTTTTFGHTIDILTFARTTSISIFLLPDTASAFSATIDVLEI